MSFGGGGPVLFACALAAIIAGLAAWDARSKTAEAAADLREMRGKMDVMQAHLSAIYMQAPHLKPKDTEE